MIKRSGKFLAILVSAVCVKYGIQAQNIVTANAAEQDNDTLISTSIDENDVDVKSADTENVEKGAAVAVNEETSEETAVSKESNDTSDSVENNTEDETVEIPEGMTQEEFEACQRINDGNGTVSDYQLFIPGQVDSRNLEFMNKAFKGKGLYAIKTDTVFKGIDKITSSIWYRGLSLEDLQDTLGYKEADMGHVDALNAKIIAEYNYSFNSISYDSIKRLECRINSIMNDIEKSEKIVLSGEGTDLDYGAISDRHYYTDSDYKDIYGGEYRALNRAMYGKTFEKLEDIQMYMRKIESIYGKMKSKTSEITAEDLNELGITDLNEFNQQYIIDHLKYLGCVKYENYNSISYDVSNISTELSNRCDDMNAGKESENGYNYFLGKSIADSNNINALNNAFKGKNIEDIYEARSLADRIVELYTKIDNGETISISDFYDLGFTNMTEDSYPTVMEYMKSLATSNRYNITFNSLYADIQKCFDSCQNSFAKINEGTAELANYDIFMIKNYYKVNKDNLDAVNATLKGKNIEYKNVLCEDVKKAYDTYSKIAAGEASTSDYIAIGINDLNDETAKFISYKIAESNLESGFTLTFNDIKDKAYSFTDETISAISNINAGEASLSDYEALELEGVDEDNISSVNEYLKNKGLCTIEQIRDYLKSYTGNTEKSVYDAINQGNSASADYAAAGITGVTDDNLSEVNSFVKNKNCFSKDKLQKEVDLIVTAIEKINEGTSKSIYYNIAGLDYVNDSNVCAVEKGVQAAKNNKSSDLTLSEISEAANASIDNMKGLCDDLSSGNAILESYETLGLKNVKEYSLGDINNIVKDINSYDLVFIQNTIDSIALPLEMINSGNAVAGDYIKLGITTITNDNIYAVNNQVKNEEAAKNDGLNTEEIRSAAEKGVQKYKEIFASITSGNTSASAADYNFIGVDTVTESNLDDVNEYINTQRYITSLYYLKYYVNKIAEPLKKINNGSKNLSDYNATSWDKGIGLLYNLDNETIQPMVDAVAKAKIEKGSDLNKAEIVAIAKEVCETIQPQYTRFKNGTATMEDFKDIGCVEFGEYFLEDARKIASEQNYKDLYNIKTYIMMDLQIARRASCGGLTRNDLYCIGMPVYDWNLFDAIRSQAPLLAEEKGRDITITELKELMYKIAFGRTR